MTEISSKRYALGFPLFDPLRSLYRQSEHHSELYLLPLTNAVTHSPLPILFLFVSTNISLA